jgi:hypothetical protein
VRKHDQRSTALPETARHWRYRAYLRSAAASALPDLVPFCHQNAFASSAA